MTRESWLKAHWRAVVTAAMAVAVFCFWYFGYPHVLAAREQSVLFLWNWQHVGERLSMPWGWARLPWEFLEQFFYHAWLGAALLALLAVLLQGLGWGLLSLVARRSAWQCRTRIAAFLTMALLAAIAVCWLPLHPEGGTDEEMRYDYLLRKGRWEKIMEMSGRQQPQELACQNAVRMAYCQLGGMSLPDLGRLLAVTGSGLKDRSTAFIMSDVYLYAGLVAQSQRASFEAMESIKDFNKSGRSLKRLVETNLVTGYYEVALKYISILEETVYYREWARRMRPLAEHPELMDGESAYARLHKIFENTGNEFFY